MSIRKNNQPKRKNQRGARPAGGPRKLSPTGSVPDAKVT